jgi:hypothetical protein
VYVMRLDNVISEDFADLVLKTFNNAPATSLRSNGAINLVGGELEAHLELSRAFSLRLSGSVLWWPYGNATRSATVGVPQNNSTVTGSVGAMGEIVADRLGYGVGVDFASPRSYNVRAGIPPSIITTDAPAILYIHGALDYRLAGSVWTSLRVQTTQPRDARQSPFPITGVMGTSLLLGVEYRG